MAKDAPSSRSAEDRKLIQACLDEDERAYGELMGRYHKSVYYTILKMVRSGEDAEDLTQEAFTKAFGSLQTFDPKYAFSTWLFRIATNCAIDFIRKKKLQTYSIHAQPNGEEQDAPAMQIKDEGLTPSEHLFRAQRKDYLQKAVQQLPTRYQRLIELRYFQELSYDEVAKELNLPLGTVKAQLHRGRELLNQALADMEQNL